MIGSRIANEKKIKNIQTFEQMQVSAIAHVSHDDFYRDKLMTFLTLNQGKNLPIFTLVGLI